MVGGGNGEKTIESDQSEAFFFCVSSSSGGRGWIELVRRKSHHRYSRRARKPRRCQAIL